MVVRRHNGEDGGRHISNGKADAGAISSTEVVSALESVVNSDTFARADRARALLAYIVETEQRGDAARLKGFTIAQDVFGKDDDFDPAFDAVVRVQAGRLREHLSTYYAREGRDDPIEIAVPKGSYVPAYTRRGAVADGSAAQDYGRDAGPIRNVDFGASARPFQLDRNADDPAFAAAHPLRQGPAGPARDPFLSPFLVRNVRRFWLALATIMVLLTVILLLVWQR